MTELEVEATSTRMPARANLLYGPSNQKVTFVIGAGSIAQEIDATTNDEGDVSVDFVPNTPGTLRVQVVQVSDPVVLTSTDVVIGT